MDNKQAKLLRVRVGEREKHDEIYLVGDTETALQKLEGEFGKAEILASVDVPDTIRKMLKLTDELIMWCTDDWRDGPLELEIG